MNIFSNGAAGTIYEQCSRARPLNIRHYALVDGPACRPGRLIFALPCSLGRERKAAILAA